MNSLYPSLSSVSLSILYSASVSHFWLHLSPFYHNCISASPSFVHHITMPSHFLSNTAIKPSLAAPSCSHLIHLSIFVVSHLTSVPYSTPPWHLLVILSDTPFSDVVQRTTHTALAIVRSACILNLYFLLSVYSSLLHPLSEVGFPGKFGYF